MKLSLLLPNCMQLAATIQPWEASVSGADQTRVMKRADALGYDSIFIPEHFIIPREHVALSGAHYFHSAAAQGYIAGATSRIRVGTCVSILPLQHPIVTAKALSTIDWMSGGRIFSCFGAGWLEEEFQMLNVPFHERGKMCDEYLAAMIELWTKESATFEGKYVNFRDAAFEPKPFQKPHLPIWLGGDVDAVMKRAARFASGWIPFLTKPEDIPARIDFIKSQAAYDGRPFEIHYSIATLNIGEGHVVLDDPKAQTHKNVQEVVDTCGWLKELGVTSTMIPPPKLRDLDAFLDHAQWVIEEVQPKLG